MRFILPVVPAVVSSVEPGTLAERIGLKEDDQYVSVGGKPIYHFGQIREIIDGYDKDSLKIEVSRNGQLISFNENFENDTIIGTYFKTPTEIYPGKIEYSFGESIPLGTERAFSVVFLQIKAFGKMFSGELSVRKSLSGPIGIAKAYGGEWGLAKVLENDRNAFYGSCFYEPSTDTCT